ncbi:maltokinase N-terminal cap-like domain-containing protein [Leucobacter sp. gxy201]|uniref:maltokinase N-terminal cap-like domain-containing protein n=1 Tax=Leucobacter sp. gxy201 TaxID=2957200 RepID=UPI003D9FD1FF
MALIYETTMSPSKLELLAAWLPEQPWFTGDIAALTPVGAYRFDDPDGEVGMEGHLLTAGDGTVYHVPLVYRGAPTEAGERFLLGTSDHGVLGERWISNAVGDPVFRAVLARTIAVGGREADEVGVNPAGEHRDREIKVRVRGSGESGAVVPDVTSAQVGLDGDVSVLESESATLTVRRVLDASYVEPEGVLTLRATWPGQVLPVVIATLAV